MLFANGIQSSNNVMASSNWGRKRKTKFAKIQSGFRNQLRLLFDKPKPGFGSTNNGNKDFSKMQLFLLE